MRRAADPKPVSQEARAVAERLGPLKRRATDAAQRLGHRLEPCWEQGHAAISVAATHCMGCRAAVIVDATRPRGTEVYGSAVTRPCTEKRRAE